MPRMTHVSIPPADLAAMRAGALHHTASAVRDADPVATARWLKVIDQLDSLARCEASQVPQETAQDRAARDEAVLRELTARLSALVASDE